MAVESVFEVFEEVGTNYVTVSIENSEVQIPIEMVAQNNLHELEADKAYSFNFNSDGKIKRSFKFTPSENGYYSFTSSLDSHGGACRADYDISISGYYDSVENNAPVRLLAYMSYTVIITANHNNCSNDTSDISLDTRLNFVTDNPAFLSLNEACTNNLTDDGTLSQLFIFTPEKTGKYEFEITTKTHDKNCEIKTSHKIYLRGKEVSSDLKAGNTYIVALSALHNNDICNQAKYKLLKVSVKPVIKSLAVKPDDTTTTTTTTVTKTTTSKPTTSTSTVIKPTSSVTLTSAAASSNTTATTQIPEITSANNTTTQPSEIPATTVNTTEAKVTTPKATKIKKLAKGKKSITVTWVKVSGVKGYQIELATDKKFKKNKKTVNIKKQKTVKATVKKLKANKKYYVRVRTYKVYKGKNVYSKWSSIKSIKTK